jgi:hypothetical protein
MSRGLFELRQYVLRAADMTAFVQLTNEKIALRTAHSPLIGYWNVEFGQINSVVHLWRYDSLAHRAKVRAALGVDKVWNGEYMNVVKPMWQSQSNALLRLTSESNTDSNATPTGAYALRFAPGNNNAGDALMAFEAHAGFLKPHSAVFLHRLASLDQFDSVVKRGDEQVLVLTPLPFSPLK